MQRKKRKNLLVDEILLENLMSLLQLGQVASSNDQ